VDRARGDARDDGDLELGLALGEGLQDADLVGGLGPAAGEHQRQGRSVSVHGLRRNLAMNMPSESCCCGQIQIRPSVASPLSGCATGSAAKSPWSLRKASATPIVSAAVSVHTA